MSDISTLKVVLSVATGILTPICSASHHADEAEEPRSFSLTLFSPKWTFHFFINGSHPICVHSFVHARQIVISALAYTCYHCSVLQNLPGPPAETP